MIRHSFTVRLALVAMAVIGLASPLAAGEQVPFNGSLDGGFTRTGFPIAFVDLKVPGQASQLGHFTLEMPHYVNLLALPYPTAIYENFLFTAANGDTVYGTVEGGAIPVAGMPGFIYGVEYLTITGGTGRFAGATGSCVTGRLIDTVNRTTIGTFEGTISSPGAGDH